MLSLQVRLLELYFRIQHTFTDPAGQTDIRKERAYLEGLGAMFKPPRGVQIVKELANGVPAEWLIPSWQPEPFQAMA